MDDLRQTWSWAEQQLGYFVPYHIMHGVYYFAGSQLMRGDSPASTYRRSQSPNTSIQQEKALAFLTSRCGLSPVTSLSSSANNSSSSSASSAVNNGLSPEILEEEQVTEEEGDRVGWEFHTVSLSRVPGYGFGIAVSGGRDNPHFANGDPAIAISDVLKAGPAEGKLMVNDRILSANGVSLEGVDYGTAVAVLRESGQTVTLSVKRRVLVPSQQQLSPGAMQQMPSPPPVPPHHHQLRVGHQYHAQTSSLPANTNASNGSSQHQRQNNISGNLGGTTVVHQQQMLKLSLAKTKKKDDFGLVLGCKIYIREVGSAAAAAVSVEDVDTLETEENSGECGGVGSAVGGVPPSLQEGDVLLRINGHPTEGMSLKEARKALEGAKGDRVSLVVKREVAAVASSNQPGHRNFVTGQQRHSETSALVKELQSQPGFIDASSTDLVHNHGQHSGHQSAAHHRSNYPPSQNLYVQPPTRSHQTPSQSMMEDKGGRGGAQGTPSRGGRSRGPLLDGWAFGQLEGGREGGMEGEVVPPRPPPPRPEDYYSSRRQLYEDDPLLQRSKQPVPDPRFITFQKEGSVGIRLTGGNEVGIFVTAVQPGSPASLQGLQPGDKILKVNGMEMRGITREEAVLLLLGLQDQVQLIVQFRKDEYDQVVASQRGDSFHVKTHFNYDNPNKGELCFRKGDVFHVVDTLHNGVVGAWQVYRIGRNNQEVQKGTIPNKSRAEELATAQFNAAKKDGGGGTSSANEGGGGRVGFFRRRRGSHRRSKSLGRDHWDDVVFGESYSSTSLASKFPAYERVSLRHPGFVRPVVLFGPLSDVARDKMLADFPDRFTTPQLEAQLAAAASGKEGTATSGRSGGIIRLSTIRDIVERGKHALLDVTPAAVERLNYARFYPIVLFLKADSKHIIKELRAGLSKGAHKSSKKLLDQSQRVEKAWSHIFTATVPLATPSTDSWYRRVRETIDRQQTSPLWISEAKPVGYPAELIPSNYMLVSPPVTRLSPEMCSSIHFPNPSYQTPSNLNPLEIETPFTVTSPQTNENFYEILVENNYNSNNDGHYYVQSSNGCGSQIRRPLLPVIKEEFVDFL